MNELPEAELTDLAAALSAFVDSLPDGQAEFLAAVLAAAGSERSEVDGFGYRASDRTQAAILAQEKAVNAQDAADRSYRTRDRRKASLDNIQKFFDLYRSFNPRF